MTASVQNLEPAAAYLPPPQSNASPDKKSGPADNDSAPSDFHSELELQHASSSGAKSADRPEKSSSRAAKKPVSADAKDVKGDAKAVAVTPVQPTEPSKVILPITLVLGQPEEHAEESSPEKPSQDKLGAAKPDLQVAQETNPTTTAWLPASVTSATPVLAAPAESKTEPKSTSNGSQPISKGDLKLPESALIEPASLKPAPAAALPETTDSKPAGPSALAFAARVTAQQNQANAAAPAGQLQAPAISDSTSAVRVPSRYAGVAPILPKAEKELDPQADLKRYAGPATERSTDSGTVLVRVESATGTSGGNSQFQSSQFQAPPQPESASRTERIIEPPAAPATSPHDIRVRVPDNNGGSTQVRFVESGGEVRVSVRTADAGLAQNLRSHLNDLSQRLADGGTPAEIWKPASDAAQSQNDQHQPDREGRGSGGQQSGSQDRQQDQQEQRPQWLEEMEASLQDQNA